MPSPAIMRVRAAVHETIAAFARADAEITEKLPIGTYVIVYGELKASIAGYVQPLDGSIRVKPLGDVPKGWKVNERGEIMVHVDHLDLMR